MVLEGTDKTGKGGCGGGAQIGFGIGRVEGRGKVGRENLPPTCKRSFGRF